MLAAAINMLGKSYMPNYKQWHSPGMFPKATHARIL